MTYRKTRDLETRIEALDNLLWSLIEILHKNKAISTEDYEKLTEATRLK